MAFRRLLTTLLRARRDGAMNDVLSGSIFPTFLEEKLKGYSDKKNTGMSITNTVLHLLILNATGSSADKSDFEVFLKIVYLQLEKIMGSNRKRTTSSSSSSSIASPTPKGSIVLNKLMTKFFLSLPTQARVVDDSDQKFGMPSSSSVTKSLATKSLPTTTLLSSPSSSSDAFYCSAFKNTSSLILMFSLFQCERQSQANALLR